MHFIDHIFMLILGIANPIYCALDNRRYIRKINAGEKAPDPAKLFRETMIIQWIALAVFATAWFALDRPVADLGFVTPGGMGFYLGIVLVALTCGFMAFSWHSVKNMPQEKRAKNIEELGDVAYFLPRNQRENRFFFWLSITAGIVEEIIYRGFVIWYLAHVMPVWGAVVVSSFIFGLSHGGYQGVAGIMRTGLVGLGFAVLFILSGSIWLPIIGHALFDILQGKTIVELLRDA